jgi:hypothetical protein
VIIDTSALIAILRAEPDASEMAHAIESALDRRISAASWLETAVVIDASRDPGNDFGYTDITPRTARRPGHQPNLMPASRPSCPVSAPLVTAGHRAEMPRIGRAHTERCRFCARHSWLHLTADPTQSCRFCVGACGTPAACLGTLYAAEA